MRFKTYELDKFAEYDPESAYAVFTQMGLEKESNYIKKKYLDENNNY
jgi:hypothetical protein